MRFVEKKILEERLQHFVEDLNPVELLPYLKCLVDTDKEKIECDSRNDGETRATRTLVDRLKKRGNEAFTEFVRALRETGCDHVAMLLDPLYNVAQGPMEEDSKDECSTRIRTMGTAIDVPLQAHITDEDGNRILELEKEIANTFSKARSQASREIRKKFSEKLPQGATFLHTKSGSIVTMFRLSKVDAAESLLEMCNGSQIVDILTELLLTNEIRGKVPDREPKLTLNITKDWFSHAKKKLEVIESGLRSGKEFEIQNCQDDENFTDDLPNFYIPPVLLDDGKSQSVLPLDLRGYQKELSEKALEGHNTVICAPTNSGKTYVALNIARNHLDKKKEQEQEGKVLFIVSTVNLVQQQTERFKLYLQDKYIVKDISGSNGCDIPLSGLLGSSHVVVLTAQILVNALKDGSLQLSSVSLLVFDECHHTQKDHPYNKIMENYMTLRLQPAHSMPTPQIVGLTASLGVGKAKNTLEAQHHILEVCANMDAQHVVTVQDETNLEELRLHVGTPQRTVHSVTCDRTDVFESVIGKAMEQVELYVKGTPVDTDMPPSGRGSQQYRHWCETLYTQGIKQSNRYLVTYAEQLRVYNVALTIKDATRSKDAMAHLSNYFNHLDEDRFTVVDRKLKKIYEKAIEAITEAIQLHGEPRNPKLVKLQELLLDYHKGETESGLDHAKGILFSKTRESTIALEKWIKETPELSQELMPLRLVGNSDGRGGMTQREQEEVIAKFRAGSECNIIIATTVAEEGLDIDDCSYVIRYDMMGNEISSVQSRGRVRTKTGGQYSVVVGQTSGALVREQRNLYRESLMADAIARVQKMDTEKRRKQVEALQRLTARERMSRDSRKRGLKSTFDASDVTLNCRKCHVFICQAHEIKRVRDSYHVTIADDFSERVDTEEIPPEHVKVFDGFMFNKKMKCKKCAEPLGAMVNYKGMELPCIKIAQFQVAIMRNGRREFATYKQWKKVPFEVEDMDFCELLELKLC